MRENEEMAKRRDVSESAETGGCVQPIGLKPRYIHDDQRKDEICRVIIRYLYAKKEIPPQWIEELRALVGS
jgi:hypothetical protein